MSARAERRAVVALFAIFALLLQALMPMVAAAAPADPSAVLCVAHGVQTAPANDVPAKGTPAQGCEHACCPAAFSAAPPDAIQLAKAVAYAAPPPLPEFPKGPTPGRGLAAPPPPSQGPPSLRS